MVKSLLLRLFYQEIRFNYNTLNQFITTHKSLLLSYKINLLRLNLTQNTLLFSTIFHF